MGEGGKQRSRAAGLAGIAAAVAVVVVAWLMASSARAPIAPRDAPPVDAPAASSSPSRSPPPPDPALRAARADGDARSRDAAAAPPRAVLPRPAPLDAGAAATARAIRIAERTQPLRDLRDNPGPNAASELEMVHAGLDTIGEDVEACLEAWAQADTQVGGKVSIGFMLDEDGLTESWVDGTSELPFGVQTCFANAVYGVDWSHVVSKPAQITNDYEIEELRDAGMSPP